MAVEGRYKHTNELVLNYTEAYAQCNNESTLTHKRAHINPSQQITEYYEYYVRGHFKNVWMCECEHRWQRDLTSDVLQRDGNTCRHLPRGPKGPVAELLVRTNT